MKSPARCPVCDGAYDHPEPNQWTSCPHCGYEIEPKDPDEEGQTEMNNWEPIASAPFGKPALVWVPFGWGMGVAIKAHSGRWVSSPPTEVEFKPLLSEPTHWMELPAAPGQEEPNLTRAQLVRIAEAAQWVDEALRSTDPQPEDDNALDELHEALAPWRKCQ